MLLEHTEPLLLTLLTRDITSHVTHRCWSYSRPQRVRLQERSSWHYNRRTVPAALWQKGFMAQVLGSSHRRANPPLRHLADGGGPPLPAMSRFYRSATENNFTYHLVWKQHRGWQTQMTGQRELLRQSGPHIARSHSSHSNAWQHSHCLARACVMIIFQVF